MTNKILSETVVVFSHNYLPINQVDLKRAVCLLVTGKAEPIEFTAGVRWDISSPSITVSVPEHIRLFRSTEKWKVPAVNRSRLLKRDSYRCQYCGGNQKLTIDHVVPRSRGGTHTWDNLVIACAGCNNRKGNCLISETGMTLAKPPKAPVHPAVALAEFWQQYSI